MTQRLDDLEVKLAHQAQEIAELNDVVTKQASEIDSLKKYIKIKLDKLQNTVEAMGADDGFKSVSDEAAANKPPHY